MITIHLLLYKPFLHVFPCISTQQPLISPQPQNPRFIVAKVSSSSLWRRSRRQFLTQGAALTSILFSGFQRVLAAEAEHPFSESETPFSESETPHLLINYLIHGAGEPAILSYTCDAGETWKLIPFTSRRPGFTPHNGNGNGSGSSSRDRSKGDRPRFFDTRAKSMCWDKAETVPGRHPDRWRKDIAGNIVFKRFHNCQGCLCFEYDHILPYSRGGLSVAENCQLLQTRVNRLKSNKEDVVTKQLKGYSCDISFNDDQLDIIEISFYGDILRPGNNECRVKSIDESRGNRKSKTMAACKLP